MSRQDRIVIATPTVSAIPEKALLREIRGPILQMADLRFFIIVLLSILFHVIAIYYLKSVKTRTSSEMVVLEKIPERFVKLIIEKPIPKKKVKKIKSDAKKTIEKDTPAQKNNTAEKTAQQIEAQTKIKRARAKKSVAARQARVERKIRTVGVLGMLTGVGSTAKGPSVVDVLGAQGITKEHSVDLEKALDNMTGLSKAVDINVVNKKLVKSKDVTISHKESIDDLIASAMPAKTATLEKLGDFIIKPPESIEGAASTNAKRDNRAINKVVSRKKSSILMTYGKYLKRNPSLSGKITIRYTISASGRVIKVVVLENTTGNDALANDIVRRVKMWRFEAVPEGEVTVTYPFVFQPAIAR